MLRSHAGLSSTSCVIPSSEAASFHLYADDQVAFGARKAVAICKTPLNAAKFQPDGSLMAEHIPKCIVAWLLLLLVEFQ